MKFLNVLKGFTLTLASGAKREFESGLQEIEDELAEHWYVGAHSEPVTAKQAKALQASSAAPALEVAPPAEQAPPVTEQEASAEPTTDAPTEG